MKTMKKGAAALAVVMTMSVGMSSMAMAASSPVKTKIGTANITAKTLKYTGEKQDPGVVVKTADGTVLRKGVDYKVVYLKRANQKSGVYKFIVVGIGRYSGTATRTYTVKASAAEQKVTVKASKKTVKQTSVKKKAATVKLTVKKGSTANKGKVSYSKSSTSKSLQKYINVSKKGVVTLKKGAKKGSYKVKVTVAAYKQFKAVTKTVTLQVK